MSYSEQMLDELDRGDINEAKALFEQVLKNDDDETKYNLAEQLYAIGFTGQAQRLYEELLGKYPDQDQIKTVLADIAVSNGDPDKAINLLSQITPESDAYAQALLTAADVYQTQGLYEVSEQKLLTAAKAFPDEPVIELALGELYYSWGKDEQASAAYSDLLKQGETEMGGIDLTQRYAATLANMGQYEEAVAAYEKEGPDKLDIASRFQLGSLYLQLKDAPKAITNLQAVIEEDASYTSAYLPLAQALEEDHQEDQAYTIVQQGLSVDETNPELYAKGADLALKQDNVDQAKTYLEKAKALDPENQHVMLAWSNLLLATHADQDNIDYLEGMDQSGDVDPQIYWNLAKSYDHTDNVKKARENYLLAFGTFQDQPDFLHDLIDFFQSTGASAELKSALTRYLKLVPDDEDMQARLDELNDENQQL